MMNRYNKYLNEIKKEMLSFLDSTDVMKKYREDKAKEIIDYYNSGQAANDFLYGNGKGVKGVNPKNFTSNS